MRNSEGPRILPWGTADTTGNRFEKHMYQHQSFPVIAHDHNLERIRL